MLGYPGDAFEEFHQGLRAAATKAQTKRFNIVVGEDFNTQPPRGQRGTLLSRRTVLDKFDLAFANSACFFNPAS